MAADELFKSVEYIGLEDPSRCELVKKATEYLAAEIKIWRDDVAVEWDASDIPDNNVLANTPLQFSVTLKLRLSLPYSEGYVRRLVQYIDLIDDRRLRGVCRAVWSQMLDQHLAQMDEKNQRFLLMTAEG